MLHDKKKLYNGGIKMRNKVPEVVLWSIFIAGLLKAYTLPAIALLVGVEFISIPDWISTPGIGHAMTISMGILPIIGIFDFYLHGKKLKRRNPKAIHWIWLFLMLFGAFFAPLERIFRRGDPASEVLWTLSDTLPSGLAFAFLVPFYKLEKEKRLLLFFIPFMLTYLGCPFAAAAKILNPSLSGFPTYERPFYLDAWFYSDMIVNIGIGAFVLWAFIQSSFLSERR